jgi:hypothetical protein
MYATFYATQTTAPSRLLMRFGLQPGNPESPWVFFPDKTDRAAALAVVYAGEPLMSWSLADLTRREWRMNAYLVLKAFLSVARNEIELRSVGEVNRITWVTGDADSARLKLSHAGSPRDGMDALAAKLVPALKCLAMAPLMTEDAGGLLDACEHLLQELGNRRVDVTDGLHIVKLMRFTRLADARFRAEDASKRATITDP